MYDGNKRYIRTEEINTYESLGLIGSVAFASLAAYNIYEHGVLYWNLMGILSNAIFFISIYQWRILSKAYDSNFERIKFKMPDLLKVLRVLFICFLARMAYNTFYSLYYLISFYTINNSSGFDYILFLLSSIFSVILLYVYVRYLLLTHKAIKRMD